MVDGKKLGSVGFKYIGTPYSEMDCQAFVERCLKDCGNNTNLAGSNAWYREVAKHGRILTPEQCVNELGTVPKGAFLFIWADDGGEPAKYHGDGMGNASHIGLCTEPEGQGAIHSSKSKGGVCESKFKNKSINGGWNRVGLWDEVDYGSGGVDPEPEPTPEPDPPSPVIETATVFAENGNSVKMRAKPSTQCKLYWNVPVGSTVEILKWDDEWSNVKGFAEGALHTGYMMSKFLIRGEYIPGDPEPDSVPPPEPNDDMVTVKHSDLYHIYELLGNILGLRG